mmetsp:Transcript_32947/g.81589  ORF Transcript_32947/g.81589 Transcript_32947/m.81589 type:complete len:206 (-) Transcript_32947:121-738(-)
MVVVLLRRSGEGVALVPPFVPLLLVGEVGRPPAGRRHQAQVHLPLLHTHTLPLALLDGALLPFLLLLRLAPLLGEFLLCGIAAVGEGPPLAALGLHPPAEVLSELLHGHCAVEEHSADGWVVLNDVAQVEVGDILADGRVARVVVADTRRHDIPQRKTVLWESVPLLRVAQGLGVGALGIQPTHCNAPEAVGRVAVELLLLARLG